jgi:hypothetical protein
MISRTRFAAFLFAAIVPLPFIALACQSSDSNSGNPTGGFGAGGSSQGGTAGNGTGGTGQPAGGAAQGGGGPGEGGANPAGGSAGAPGGECGGEAVTIADLNQYVGDPALKPQARLTGVVATSQKFLVSPSKSGCLWGVYVTMPGEAAEYGSIQLVTKGAVPTAGANGSTVCSTDADKSGIIPNDIAPGDVVNVSGFISEFLSNSCGMVPDGGAMANPKPAAAQRQMTPISCMEVTKGGGVATPHVADAALLDQLAAGTDEALLRKWSGALLTLQGALTAKQDPSDTFGMGQAVSNHGAIFLNESSIVVNNGIYYNDITCTGPKDPTKKYTYALDTAFTSVTGIFSLNFCTWQLSVRTKCGDIAPTSPACSGEDCPPSTPEDNDAACSDGQDNDNNGFVDCKDFGCSKNPAVTVCAGTPEDTDATCSDGIDNDNNGFTDCKDFSCSKSKTVTVCPMDPGTPENTAAACADKLDNDNDGFADCEDKDCCSVVDCKTSAPMSFCGKM